MKLRTITLIGAISALGAGILHADPPAAPIVFDGIAGAPDGSHVTLWFTVDGHGSGWIKPGQAFGDYVLVRYDAKKFTATVQKHDKTFDLDLQASHVKEAPALGFVQDPAKPDAPVGIMDLTSFIDAGGAVLINGFPVSGPPLLDKSQIDRIEILPNPPTTGPGSGGIINITLKKNGNTPDAGLAPK